MNEPGARHFAEALHPAGLQSLTSGNFYQTSFLEILIQVYPSTNLQIKFNGNTHDVMLLIRPI
jgi:hypothetical protein